MLDWSNPFRALFIQNKATITSGENTNTLFCGDSLDISGDVEQIVVAQGFINRRDCGAKLGVLGRSTSLDPLTFQLHYQTWYP